MPVWLGSIICAGADVSINKAARLTVAYKIKAARRRTIRGERGRRLKLTRVLAFMMGLGVAAFTVRLRPVKVKPIKSFFYAMH